MVDLQGQYLRLKAEIEEAVLDVLSSGQFIQGKQVSDFESELAAYTGSPFVISCANGTDALQLACMALPLERGDKVMVPAFTYIATAEVLHLLGLQPIYCDVDPLHFMLTPETLEKAWQPGCKAVMLVHLFGQCPDMEAVMEWAAFRGLWVIEDNAQSIGSVFNSRNVSKQAGTMGIIGTTSFFPSKNLGAYGDAGALFTADENLAHKLRMMANHGQSKRYYHDTIGVNSRMDTIQAAILRVKLKYLDDFIQSRQNAAVLYDERLSKIEGLHIPVRQPHSTHVFHQYTLRLDLTINRQQVQDVLQKNGISSAVYYPLPVYAQKAYQDATVHAADFPVTEYLCKSVLSLPMHTELNTEAIDYICNMLYKAIHG